MVKKTILLSMLSLCASIHTSAQSADGYVYVTDVITSTDLGKYIGDNFTKEFSKNCKKYKFTGNKDDGRFALANNQSIAVIGDVLPAFLAKIDVEWDTANSSTSEIAFWGKNSVYADNSDITDGDTENDGEFITAFTYNKSNRQQTYNLPNSLQYIAAKKSSNIIPYITSISFTWQLIYKRAGLTIGNLGTLCLPYSIKAEDMEGITAYTISGKVVENGEVTSIVFDLTDHIEAGKPYLFVANSKEIFLKYSGNKADAPICEKGMYGVYERHPFADDSNFNEYDYYVITKNNTIQRASSASGVNANCAFIKMDEVPEYSPAQSNGRNLILTSEGFTQTDIAPTLLNSLQSPNSSSTTIDLSGRRITNGAAPTITVHNGKKILSK